MILSGGLHPLFVRRRGDGSRLRLAAALGEAAVVKQAAGAECVPPGAWP